MPRTDLIGVTPILCAKRCACLQRALGFVLLAVVAPARSAELETIPLPVKAAAGVADSTATRTTAIGVAEIIVTAQRREESINDVPIAINAYSGDTLTELGITDSRDLDKLVPGFSVANVGFAKPIYTLRGVGFNETSQMASSTVGIYVDELNLPFDAMSKGANLDLERVEVLKGPQGTLFGRNTAGGAVNYIPRGPTAGLESGATLSYGRFETSDAELFVSGPVTNATRARLAVRDIRARHGWQTSLTRPDDRLGRVDKQSARLIVDWDALETLPVRLMLQGWRDASEPQVPQAIAIEAQNPLLGAAALHQDVRNHPVVDPDARDSRLTDWPTGLPWQLHESFVMASLRGQWMLGESSTLSLQGAYQDYRSDDSLIPQNGLSVVNVENRLDSQTTALTLEARMSGRWHDDAPWQFGFFHGNDDVDENLEYLTDTVSALFPLPGPAASPAQRDAYDALLATLGLGTLASLPLLPGDPLISDRFTVLAHQRARSDAAYGDIQLPLAERWTGTVGLRYTREHRDYRGCSADSDERSVGLGFAPFFSSIQLLRPVLNPGSGIPTRFAQPGGCFTLDTQTNNAVMFRDELDEDNFSGRLALNWTPREQMLLYVSLSRGYKSGSFPAINASDTLQLEPVKQERLDALETGGKLGFFDRRMQFNYAVFGYRYKNKQLFSRTVDPFFGTLPLLRNAPRSRVYGAELEILSRPLAGLELSLAGAWLDTRILKLDGYDESGEMRDFSGRPFNFAPRWSYAVIASYARPLIDDLDLRVTADHHYKSGTNSSLSGMPLFRHAPYRCTDLRIGVARADDRWSVSLWARNLFDNFETVGVFDPGDAVVRYTGLPRTYGLTATLRWR